MVLLSALFEALSSEQGVLMMGEGRRIIKTRGLRNRCTVAVLLPCVSTNPARKRRGDVEEATREEEEKEESGYQESEKEED